MRDRRVVVLAGLAACHHLVVGAAIGLGDAEALYVVYGRNLAAGYLDHPPLVGWLLALFGAQAATARLPAALCIAATVLYADGLARRLGASAHGGLWAAIALLSVPMFAAGSLATTPDAIAAPLCLATVWAAVSAVESRRAAHAALAGALLGAAFLAKVTAALYVPGLVWLAVRRRAPVSRLVLAGAVALAVASPYVLWSARQDWIGLTHRLVWTQPGAGPSWRNLGALIGGQLAYVGPPMLVLLVSALRRGVAEAPRLVAIPALVGVALLGLWSRVAEPHWTAAAWLPLVAAAGVDRDAVDGPRRRRLRRVAVGWGLGVLLVLHAIVLTPLVPALVPTPPYDPRWDLANELHGWPAVARRVRRLRRGREPVAAGHWTMCAQLEVALGEPVLCPTREVDDWDLWGRGALASGRTALFVTDARYPEPPGGARPRGALEVRRGGRVVRRFGFWAVGP
jgi:4-amino-4-deoxy-L-arabinose transferase-like glycosyltransferase